MVNSNPINKVFLKIMYLRYFISYMVVAAKQTVIVWLQFAVVRPRAALIVVAVAFVCVTIVVIFVDVPVVLDVAIIVAFVFAAVPVAFSVTCTIAWPPFYNLKNSLFLSTLLPLLQLSCRPVRG